MSSNCRSRARVSAGVVVADDGTDRLNVMA
jgi:hypothetical protein